MPILLEDFNLRKTERLLCKQALSRGGNIVRAAELLGITRHSLKRRMIKHQIDFPLVADPVPATALDAREHRLTVPERVSPPESL